MALAKHSNIIHASRIEQIFSETNQTQLILNLSQIFQLITDKTNTKVEIDLGLLAYDLNMFELNKQHVLHRWATDFFTN
jgi:hypothetical protein